MMKQPLRIGLVGDYDDKVIAHHAIPEALRLSSAQLHLSVDHQWLPTEHLSDAGNLHGFDGLWCVPGTPYRNMEGVRRRW